MSDGMAAAPVGLPAAAPQRGRGWRQRLLRGLWWAVKLLLGLVVVGAVPFVAIRYYHTHNRLERWWFGHDEHMQQVWKPADGELVGDVSLHRYAPDLRTRIDGVRDNFSGLAYMPEHAVRRWKIRFHDQRNSGYEGLAYDAATDSLYIAKEKNPVALYRIRQFSTLPQGQTPALEDVSQLLAGVPFLTDLSAIAFRADTGGLLLLSDESQSLAEIDAQGRLLGVRSLMPERWWDTLPMPRPEGLALDAAGHICVASEPNGFYRYRPQASF